MPGSIAKLLIEYGRARLEAKRGLVVFTKDTESDALLNDLKGYPHAFVTACLMDRQITAERAWRIPHALSARLGTFEFEDLARMNATTIVRAYARPPALHRFAAEMARIFSEAISRIRDDYGGDAANLWKGRPSSADVVYRFLQFRGAGPKIATMAVNILARDFKVELSDYYSVDISVDVHIRRVFHRLGLTSHDATESEILYSARALSPEFPGLLDLAAWEIGKSWCRPRTRRCESCYMRQVCPSSSS